MVIYNDLKKRYNLNDQEICFCGDDIQDLSILEKVGFSCCPKNAQDGIKNICDYISPLNGGEGFVREICNIFVISVQRLEPPMLSGKTLSHKYGTTDQ